MSKPIVDVTVKSMEGTSAKVRAVFDSGSHYSIIQEAKLPPKTLVHRYAKSETLKTATVGGRLHISGRTLLIIHIGTKRVSSEVLVSPDLSKDMLVGAGTMQMWDISIKNGGGRTRITVGHDLDDPEVQEVD